MEGGVEGGVVGGVIGGVVGGVIGGTGTGPVPVSDYDRAPRLVRQTKPRYPPEAFVKKVQGVVLVEFLIDSTGRVSHPRVVRSIPLLDEAALEAVREWVFYPALRRGQAVPTIARAPVSFTIY
jgi:protein TonB